MTRPSRVPGRRWFLLWLTLLAPLPLAAQVRAVAAGQVLRAGATDTLGVPGSMVVLHRVGRTVQGPVDSVRTDASGRFRFRYLADTTAVYLLSTGYRGIEYFSTPLHTDPTLPDTGLILAVSDTSSRAPVLVESRHLVLSRPAKDGTRAVLEIVVLANPGPDTRVSPDTSHPSWVGEVPGPVLNFQVGQGDVSTEALSLVGNRVELYAPVAPGEKQLLYTYQVPATTSRLRIPFRDSVGVFNLLVEEQGLPVRGGGLVKGDSQAIEGRSFRQWSGPMGPGDVAELDLPGGGTGWVLPALVAAVALALVGVLVRHLRRPAAVPARGPSLLDQLAALDARYAGKQDELPVAAWEAYQAERSRLKQLLTGQLAGKEPVS